jgi:putative hemolysin
MELDQVTSPAVDRAVDDVGTAAKQSAQPVRLEALWARHEDEVRQAQRLRYQVFAEEMGARLSPLPGTPAGLDVDRFDAACEHLIVRTVEAPGVRSEVVGTYRVLTPVAAQFTGGLYSESEFDLRNLDALRPRMAELGRSCTASAWRNGGVILLLWTSLAEFIHRNGLDVVVGCASVPMHDGGHVAASLWNALQRTHLAEPERQVRPRLPLPVDDLDGTLEVEAPSLIKGYLRCGARVLGAPAWDPDFGVADLPMMLALKDLPPAYRRRFIGG